MLSRGLAVHPWGTPRVRRTTLEAANSALEAAEALARAASSLDAGSVAALTSASAFHVLHLTPPHVISHASGGGCDGGVDAA